MTRVVLIHGLGRTRLAMLPLARALRRAGYETHNVGYFAARRPLETIAARLSQRLDALLDETGAHFVTHSLGGVLARHYLARRPHLRPSRLVQLAPPNQGALIAERIHQLPLIGRIPGRTLRDLGLEEGVPRLELPPLDEAVEVGVIAGGRGDPRGYGPWLPEDSDGIVQVHETYLPEARDWILLPCVHTFIMNDAQARANVAHFLEHGAFLPEAPRLQRSPEGVAHLDPGVDGGAQPSPSDDDA